jgi:hypothetical protein
MFKKNLGRLDRTVRLIAGVALVLIGLFLLRGWQGNGDGILVTAAALGPLTTSLIGSCPAYTLFGVSTLEERRGKTERATTA